MSAQATFHLHRVHCLRHRFIPNRPSIRHGEALQQGENLMAKEILCGFGVDVDAVAGWLGSYGGDDSPDDISRGLFAGEVGSPRLLKMFNRLGSKTPLVHPRTFDRDLS